jgi:hypothetical protein
MADSCTDIIVLIEDPHRFQVKIKKELDTRPSKASDSDDGWIPKKRKPTESNGLVQVIVS